MKKIGILTAIAIADAYGAGFEFNTKEHIEKYNDLVYKNRNGEPIPIGKYTDDTQMSIAIAEMLIEGDIFTHEKIMDRFINCYSRDERPGYSKQTKNLLSQSYSDYALEQVKPRPSNGCAMRVLPLCLIKDVEEMKHKVIMQTTCTHPNIDCINATMLLALTGYYLYHQLEMEMEEWMNQHMSSNQVIQIFKAYKGGEVKNNVIQTVSFVLQNIINKTSSSQILKDAINAGGDTDSTAALSMGLWSLKGLEFDLPDILNENLENVQYGKHFLMNLDLELENKFKK